MYGWSSENGYEPFSARKEKGEKTMDAVEFLKARKRLCNSSKYCENCPLYIGSGYCRFTTSGGLDECKVVSTVEEWAKEHPFKTRQSEFLKMFPNALIVDEKALGIYPCKIDETIKLVNCIGDCTRCRSDYWLQEVE